jgi:proline dehydrogenase
VTIREIQNLFSKFDLNNDGIISREEFQKGYQLFFTNNDDENIPEDDILQQLDPQNTGKEVDYITWSSMFNLRDLPKITTQCKKQGPLALATPTDEEIGLWEDMFQRAEILVEEAKKDNTKLLFDAEQIRFQPAIDHLVFHLQRKYNNASSSKSSVQPIIYNTYQCYLKDTTQRLRTDLERSRRFRYNFGAKLVRGAYMESERALAKAMNVPSPIYDTIEDTHHCYDECVELLLRQQHQQQQ